jgi:hypothetical protein
MLSTLRSRSNAALFLVLLAFVAQMLIARAMPAVMGHGVVTGVVLCDAAGVDQPVGKGEAPSKSPREHDCSACLLHCQLNAFSKSTATVFAAPRPAISLARMGDATESFERRLIRGDAHPPRAPPFLS